VTVADASFVGSVLLVAVIVAEALATGVGAVNKPLVLIDPTDAVQVTPALAESLATAAVNAWVAPATIATGLRGLMVTLMAGVIG